MSGSRSAQYGFSREQAYILTSVAVDLRISEAVNFPNVLVSAFLPLDIFEA
ncbi:MAG: acetamidase/formamidase family protein [Candidatus Acidiferrales bacterium]